MSGARTGDWVAEIADRVVAEGNHAAHGGRIVCASGISPSGPVHLGNLREILVPHFIADELRRRGLDVEHILSWDDYDRLRKVPAGVPASFAEHIGRPLSGIPDPTGEHASWAEHFKQPLRDALAELGVELREISQTEQYTAGAYRDQVLLAMRERRRIDEVLGSYRTKKTEEPDEDDAASVAGFGYSPYKPFCADCGRDTTTVTGYDEATTRLDYTCSFGHEGSYELNGTPQGKLVWKVDWPMRWAYEGVTFESGGVDHSSPGSSFTVGGRLVRDVFDGEPPVYAGYSFVGVSGMAKMSSSSGGAPTPADALGVLEPPLLRWQYARRKPAQSFTVGFGPELVRLYDEWDTLVRKVGDGSASELQATTLARSTGTATRTLPTTPRPLPFRTLSAVVDLVAGDETQMQRIFADVTADDPIPSLDVLRPRLDRAQQWMAEHVPAEDRTRVRDEPDTARLEALDAEQREAVRLLLEGLKEHWSLDGLTTLVYGVPKTQRGLPLDTPPTPELKTAQREFFALLYALLVGSDTGPRLPTLLLALGQDRLAALLTP